MQLFGTAQIERRRKLGVGLGDPCMNRTRRVTKGQESRSPSRLGFGSIDREGCVVAATRMSHMIGTSTQRSSRVLIHQVNHQRRVNGDRGMQTRRGLPCAIANPCNPNVWRSTFLQGNDPSIAKDLMPIAIEPLGNDLNPLDRRVDKSNRSATTRFFPSTYQGSIADRNAM